ncbi:hypothetical protein NF865_00530 [Thermococcus aggregans]|uniref:Uncharacterized protein n=1 Tax=Thermococcus aggregans TaxID=110163 RepID=A0A9E7MXJ7_THEAG|nr:hypothetical protein [Thermococcus aggregans]USS40758.1 hypothetical protein NF865_00530 [Thermococcus aggregans]
MREVFNKEGIFIKYEEKTVELESGDKLTHRQEIPTELWWLLKETIKGKKVRIIAYEIEE